MKNEIKNVANSTQFCRDRGGFRSITNYRISTCSECYSYLFLGKVSFKLKYVLLRGGRNEPLKYLFNRQTHEYVFPDIRNQTSMDAICSTMTGEQYGCDDWSQCCQNAWKCCEKQLQTEDLNKTRHAHCPQTWDGWACWDYSDAGSTVSQVCPAFLKYIFLEMNRKSLLDFY